MAGKSSAAETPVETVAATGTPEPVAPPADPAQEIIANEAETLKKQIADAAALVEKLTSERNNAIANALRADAQYKGLQSQTTKTLQQAAADRRALAVAQAQAAEVSDMKSLLQTLAGKVLDEDEAKQLQWTQKELELKRREAAIEAAKTAPAEETVATPQQYTNPTDERARFLSWYFPGVEIDPNDPNIDWASDASGEAEAMKRFIGSVMKIKDQKDATKTNDAVSVLKQQSETQLAELKAKQDELVAKTAQEIEDAKAAAIEEARKETEKRLRAMGADVAGTPAPDGSGNKTFGQQLEEVLDDNLLRQGPKGVAEYNRRVEAMKKQVRERFNKS